MLRQDRILYRAEQRRLGAHGKQHREHHWQVAEQHTGCAQQHNHDLSELDLANQRVLGKLLTKLATKGREQEERQDKQQRAEVDQQGLIGPGADLEQNGENQ